MPRVKSPNQKIKELYLEIKDLNERIEIIKRTHKEELRLWIKERDDWAATVIRLGKALEALAIEYAKSRTTS